MKTIEEFKDGTSLNISSVANVHSGYGHKKISVELEYRGEYKKFETVTSNMPDFDNAMDLEGVEKSSALYNIIQSTIEDQVSNWMEDIDHDLK